MLRMLLATAVSLVLLAESASAQDKPATGIVAQAVSPDGKVIASGREDSIVILNAANQQELRRIQGHKGKVVAVAFSPDGKTLASGGDDETIRVWDIVTGKEIYRVQGKKPVRAVTFSRDGKTLTVQEGDKTLRVWDAATGQELAGAGQAKQKPASDNQEIIQLLKQILQKLEAKEGKSGWQMVPGPELRLHLEGAKGEAAAELWRALNVAQDQPKKAKPQPEVGQAKATVEQAKAELERAWAHVKVAEATVAQAKARLAQAEANFKAVLKAAEKAAPAPQASDLEQRLDRLLREVQELQQQLQQKKK